MNWNGDCFILNNLFYANVNYSLNCVFHFPYGVEYVQMAEGETEISWASGDQVCFLLLITGNIRPK